MRAAVKSLNFLKRVLSSFGRGLELAGKDLPDYDLLLARLAYNSCGYMLSRFEHES
jgi:hypothetical protein